MADNTATILHELSAETTHVADSQYRLQPGTRYTFNLNGDGVWEYWDGNAYVAFTEGSGKNFSAQAPTSGLVQLNWISGTVYAGFFQEKV
jgi:hypothetical protein